MTDIRQIAPDEDPVCGMHVNLQTARDKGLTLELDGREYAFCGKGCFLEFRDDPSQYLDPNHTPSM
jgi:YHS domain-containing protein